MSDAVQETPDIIKESLSQAESNDDEDELSDNLAEFLGITEEPKKPNSDTQQKIPAKPKVVPKIIPAKKTVTPQKSEPKQDVKTNSSTETKPSDNISQNADASDHRKKKRNPFDVDESQIIEVKQDDLTKLRDGEQYLNMPKSESV